MTYLSFKTNHLRSIVLVILSGFLLSSCKNNSSENTTTESYKLFELHQQGWKSKRINQFINDINFTATEVPLQYYLLKDKGIGIEAIDSIYNINKRERIVEIEFQHVEEKDLLLPKFTSLDYEESVKYMASKIKKDFIVVTSSNDTIACSGVLFERNFKVAPFKRLLLYFGNINPNDNIKLIYNDQLFGNGLIKFNFKEIPLKL